MSQDDSCIPRPAEFMPSIRSLSLNMYHPETPLPELSLPSHRKIRLRIRSVVAAKSKANQPPQNVNLLLRDP